MLLRTAAGRLRPHKRGNLAGVLHLSVTAGWCYLRPQEEQHANAGRFLEAIPRSTQRVLYTNLL